MYEVLKNENNSEDDVNYQTYYFVFLIHTFTLI